MNEEKIKEILAKQIETLYEASMDCTVEELAKLSLAMCEIAKVTKGF